ncbi:hypothetical protein ACF1AB_28550 [Streptomyces sp. NPDC014846]|uniref:hypothetical protein n=1 Tax=Streptomyces sp. NPDC014846 TaxID=3364922 RepID=UPI0036FB81E0
MAEACHTQIRSALTMTFPDGSPVAEFMLHIHDDGTAGWRRHDESFDVPRVSRCMQGCDAELGEPHGRGSGAALQPMA